MAQIQSAMNSGNWSAVDNYAMTYAAQGQLPDQQQNQGGSAYLSDSSGDGHFPVAPGAWKGPGQYILYKYFDPVSGHGNTVWIPAQ
jgi:hypothetical protein